jgi:multidrug resistance efflux pump
MKHLLSVLRYTCFASVRNSMIRCALGIAALLLVVLVAACQSTTADTNSLRLSGVLEATKVNLAAEVGGRVDQLLVDEGDQVQAGQTIVNLSRSELETQVMQAQAAVSAAEANLAQVKASTRQEVIDAAQAALQQAQAERDGAFMTYSDTLKIRNNPQELLAQIDAARAGAKLAEQNVSVAQTKVNEARYWREFYDNDHARRETLDKQIGIAQKNLEAAQAQLDGAKAQVAALDAMRRTPIALQSQVNAASNAYSITLANVQVAAANLADLKAGPTPEDVALAEAKVHQAQAQLKLAQAYQSRATIAAPLTGIVSERSAHAGETIQPGGALLSIINLDEVDMLIYVPQEHLPRVKIGSPVKVYVDAYANEPFEGNVVSIAQQAQFSSRDTQAQEDRANIVFAVKVRLPNNDHRLKAGMTADAVIELR